MSCAVGVGVAVVDLGLMGTALGAVTVVVVGGVALTAATVAAAKIHEAHEQHKMDQLLSRMAEEEITTAVMNREAFRNHIINQRLKQANVASQFEGSDVIMETEKGEVLGFKMMEDGTYTLNAKYGTDGIAEWRGSNEEIEQRLRQQYAYMKVKKEVEKRGYAVVEEEILEDNSIRVHVRRWG